MELGEPEKKKKRQEREMKGQMVPIPRRASSCLALAFSILLSILAQVNKCVMCRPPLWCSSSVLSFSVELHMSVICVYNFEIVITISNVVTMHFIYREKKKTDKSRQNQTT